MRHGRLPQVPTINNHPMHQMFFSTTQNEPHFLIAMDCCRILKSKFVPILPILRLFLFSDFNTILRSFRLYDYNICYSLILHDSPIFPIIRFFRLLFCHFTDSPSTTRFSDFSDYTILLIVILRFFRFSAILSDYTILSS